MSYLPLKVVAVLIGFSLPFFYLFHNKADKIETVVESWQSGMATRVNTLKNDNQVFAQCSALSPEGRPSENPDQDWRAAWECFSPWIQTNEISSTRGIILLTFLTDVQLWPNWSPELLPSAFPFLGGPLRSNI